MVSVPLVFAEGNNVGIIYSFWKSFQRIIENAFPNQFKTATISAVRIHQNGNDWATVIAGVNHGDCRRQCCLRRQCNATQTANIQFDLLRCHYTHAHTCNIHRHAHTLYASRPRLVVDRTVWVNESYVFGLWKIFGRIVVWSWRSQQQITAEHRLLHAKAKSRLQWFQNWVTFDLIEWWMDEANIIEHWNVTNPNAIAGRPVILVGVQENTNYHILHKWKPYGFQQIFILCSSDFGSAVDGFILFVLPFHSLLVGAMLFFIISFSFQ